jgi:hypothetical protein
LLLHRRLREQLQNPPGAALLHDEDIGESRVLPALAVLTAATLYATLPGKFIAGSGILFVLTRWGVTALAILLLAPLLLTAPKLRVPGLAPRRTIAIAVIAVMSLANAGSIILLVHLIAIGRQIDANELVRAAIHIWCASVLIFALWFWQLDSGGPAARRLGTHTFHDFLFPQQAAPEIARPGWRPDIVDYL